MIYRIMGIIVVIGLVLRIIILQDLSLDQISIGSLGIALTVGIFHDLLVGLVITTLFLSVAHLWPRAALPMLFCICFIVAIASLADIFFWWEFEGRLNRLVFHYLLFPEEVLVFLEEQFFVSIFVLPFLILVYGLFRLVKMEGELPKTSTTQIGLLLVVTALVLVSAEPFSYSDSRKVNQLVSNGWLSLLQDAVTDARKWHDQYWEPVEEEVSTIVLAENQNQHKDGSLSEIRHVVLIVEESFGGEVWRDSELREKFLPNFSRLMREGLYFNHIYATGSRTTRGLEAILNGFPPLPGIAVTQRSGYKKLPSLPRALARNGFYNIFVYGGWPNFSNFSEYWEALGYEEQTNREDFDSAMFETSWGVSDEELFTKVCSEMERLTIANDRVFLTALTVSHHRPFDIPEGRIPFPSGSRKSEYALAYADWALGKFFLEASKEEWFDDTLFVVVSDHGPHISGDTPIPIDGFRVPMIFFSPGNISSGEVSRIGSTMSLGVTILDLLGIENEEGLYGSNLIYDTDQITPVEHDYHVGLVSERGLTVLHRDGRVSSWERANGNFSLDKIDYDEAAKASKLFSRAHDWFYAEEGQ
tara:strand:+ start:2901 stop:4661 length:1761 start_codon:yes stop_codon:yes gene_type:complete